MSDTHANTAVWFEIPVTDLEASVAFYNAVMEAGLKIDDSGPNPMAVFNPETMMSAVSGHLYPGKPSENGPTIHLAAKFGLAETRRRVEAAGGKVESDDIPLPAGAFFYARDLDGNSIGFYEASAA